MRGVASPRAQPPAARRRTNRGAPALPAPAVPRRRRALRTLAGVLVVAGALLLADAAATVLWQEPVTALITSRRQHALGDQLARLRAAVPPAQQRAALARLAGQRSQVAYLAAALRRAARPGQAVGRIEIPKLGASFVVVKGSQPGDLRKGPGVYDGMPFPGEAGTTAIAGHRTTYLAPFRHVDELRPGDAIALAMPYATLRYRVQQVKVIEPTDTSVLARQPYDRLVLTACHPLFSAAQRIVVLARLVDSRPGPVLQRVEGGVGRPASDLKPGSPVIR